MVHKRLIRTCDMNDRTCEKKEREFVEWYREFFQDDRELPCLRCSDDRIVKCSNAVVSNNIGCTLFQQYVLNTHAENSGKRGYE